MKAFKLTKISILEAGGEYGTKFWCTTPDSDFALMFYCKKDLKEGMTIAVEEVPSPQTSKGKGIEYLFLKQIKVLEGSGSPRAEENLPTQIAPQEATQASQSPGLAVGHFNLLMKELRDIKADVKRLLGEDVTDEQVDKPMTVDDLGFEEMPEDFLK